MLDLHDAEPLRAVTQGHDIGHDDASKDVDTAAADALDAAAGEEDVDGAGAAAEPRARGEQHQRCLEAQRPPEDLAHCRP